MAISTQCLLQPNWGTFLEGTEFSIGIFCPVTLFSAKLSRILIIKIQEWRLRRQIMHVYFGMGTYLRSLAFPVFSGQGLQGVSSIAGLVRRF
jgi:hypothetical protein